MKIYKVEVFIIDFDELGPDEIKSTLENTKYPNRCMSPKVGLIEEKEIGEWDDNHELNKSSTDTAEYFCRI